MTTNHGSMRSDTPARGAQYGSPGLSWRGDGALAPHRDPDEVSSAGAWSASAGAPPAELLAGFWHRAVGFVVDLVIIVLIVQVAYAALFPRELDLIGTEQGILQVGTVNLGVRFAYNWFFNARGWSPGKRVVGLRIVTAAGQPPGAGPGLARALGAILSEAALWLGYAWASLDGRRQTWHDKIGGTYVIRVSAPRKQTPD